MDKIAHTKTGREMMKKTSNWTAFCRRLLWHFYAKSKCMCEIPHFVRFLDYVAWPEEVSQMLCKLDRTKSSTFFVSFLFFCLALDKHSNKVIFRHLKIIDSIQTILSHIWFSFSYADQWCTSAHVSTLIVIRLFSVSLQLSFSPFSIWFCCFSEFLCDQKHKAFQYEMRRTSKAERVVTCVFVKQKHSTRYKHVNKISSHVVFFFSFTFFSLFSSGRAHVTKWATQSNVGWRQKVKKWKKAEKCNTFWL